MAVSLGNNRNIVMSNQVREFGYLNDSEQAWKVAEALFSDFRDASAAFEGTGSEEENLQSAFRFVADCQELTSDQATALRRIVRNSTAPRNRLEHTHQVLSIMEFELSTWSLLDTLYQHRLAGTYQEYPEVPPIDHMGVFNALMQTDDFMLLLRLREWLEHSSRLCEEDSDVAHRLDAPNCLRSATISQATKNPSTKRLHPLTPDVQHNDTLINADDRSREHYLYACLLKYIRCGRMQDAVSLCERIGEHVRAAFIQSMSLWHEPNLNDDGSQMVDGKRLAEGNSNRVLARYVLWQTTQQEELDMLERCAIAALCGRLDMVLGRCLDFHDKLWAYIRCAIEYRLDGRLRQSDEYWQQNISSVPVAEENTEQQADHALLDIIDDALTSNSSYTETIYERVQKMLLQDKSLECVAFMHEYAFQATAQQQNTSQSDDETDMTVVRRDRGTLTRHHLRFVAHLALAIKRLDLEHEAWQVEEIVEMYVQMLIDESEVSTQLITHYVCQMSVHKQIASLALYMSGIKESSTRHDVMVVMVQHEPSLPLLPACIMTVQLAIRNYAANQSLLPSDMWSPLEWLCYTDDFKVYAFHYANKMLAEFILEDKSEAVHQLLDLMPHDEHVKVLDRDDQLADTTQVVLTVYLAFKAYSQSLLAYDKWVQHAGSAKPRPPEDPRERSTKSDAFIARAKYEQDMQLYEERLARWHRTSTFFMEEAVKHLRAVLTFGDGWMRVSNSRGVDDQTQSSADPVAQLLRLEYDPEQVLTVRQTGLNTVVSLLVDVLNRSEDVSQLAYDVLHCVNEETDSIYQVLTADTQRLLMQCVNRCSIQSLNQHHSIMPVLQ